jgi:hypothetical protein
MSASRIATLLDAQGLSIAMQCLKTFEFLKCRACVPDLNAYLAEGGFRCI